MPTESVVIEGAKELEALLAQMPGRALGILGGALVECGEEVMAKSVKLAPKKTGALRNSGRVFGAWGGQTRYARSGFGTMRGGQAASISGMGGQNGAEVTMAYGGAALGYAAYVHEAPPELNWTLPGTGPKFLERPAKEYPLGSKLAAKVRGRLERALAGKGGA